MMTDGVKRGIIQWATRGLVAKLVVILILLLSAGRWDWSWAWVYLAVFVVFDAATALVVLPRHPALLAERSQVQEGTKGWDQVLVRLTAVYFPMASWVVAGLDERWGWMPAIPPAAQIAALLATIVGYGLTVWAMGANAYFSTTVRLQRERGHEVVTTGPYRIVRHPGYVGAILFTVAAPLMLGSVWAAIPGGVGAALYLPRTVLEDRVLRAELDGYQDYARRVRHRLVPGVW